MTAKGNGRALARLCFFCPRGRGRCWTVLNRSWRRGLHFFAYQRQGREVDRCGSVGVG